MEELLKKQKIEISQCNIFYNFCMIMSLCTVQYYWTGV